MGAIAGMNLMNETAGSIAYTSRKCADCPEGKPCEKAVAFRGNDTDTFESSEKKKPNKALLATAIAIGVGVLSVVGLGYAHKKGPVDLFKDATGWKATANNYLNTAAEKCHEWCSTVKSTGQKWLNTVKGWFGGKKG